MTLPVGEILTGLAALVTAIILLIKAQRSSPHEAKGMDADAVTKFEAVAVSAAQRAELIAKRMDELEAKIDRLESENEELRQENVTLRGILEETKAQLEKTIQMRIHCETRINELEAQVRQLQNMELS